MRFSSAMSCFEDDFDACIAQLRVPVNHCRRPAERMFCRMRICRPPQPWTHGIQNSLIKRCRGLIVQIYVRRCHRELPISMFRQKGNDDPRCSTCGSIAFRWLPACVLQPTKASACPVVYARRVARIHAFLSSQHQANRTSKNSFHHFSPIAVVASGRNVLPDRTAKCTNVHIA